MEKVIHSSLHHGNTESLYRTPAIEQVGFTSELHVVQKNELLAMTFKKRITVNLF